MALGSWARWAGGSRTYLKRACRLLMDEAGAAAVAQRVHLALSLGVAGAHAAVKRAIERYGQETIRRISPAKITESRRR
jgi:hypothetical protein